MQAAVAFDQTQAIIGDWSRVAFRHRPARRGFEDVCHPAVADVWEHVRDFGVTEGMQYDHAALAMFFERRSLAPLSSFSFVNRAAYIFSQHRVFYGSHDARRHDAASFIARLKKRPLGSAGSKEQIADRYVNLRGTRPLWYVTTHGEAYYLPDHDMM